MQLLILCPLIFIASFIDSIAGGGGRISLTSYQPYSGLGRCHNRISILGNIVGSQLAIKKDVKIIRPLMLTVVILLFIKIVLDFFGIL